VLRSAPERPQTARAACEPDTGSRGAIGRTLIVGGAGLNWTPGLIDMFVLLLCMVLPRVSYTFKQDQKRDRKGRAVRDERTKDLRVSIGSRWTAPLMTTVYVSLLGWSRVSGEAG
jgi:hypothetical protein